MSSEKQPKPKKLPTGYRDILKSIDDFFQQTYQHLQEIPLFDHPIPIRVYEQSDYLLIEAELPGVDKQQIHLDIYRQSVRIQVNHSEQVQINNEKNDIVEKRESTQVRERIIPIPFSIEKKDVKAAYRNGLLKIKIPNKRQNIQID
ncbi:Hsp20/alpha crystallin family protein [Halalkalibacter urbisdiaboli]|uniref:Hsp20/alpha crystallin family protein n=1 Tax=Halalkalibacter urbisdiaboli TaxID=1960589 RepID=UPI0013FE2404|nr:Hsp20/alpha crystallin family protein [Halalkalibacter urbisdiaboli]